MFSEFSWTNAVGGSPIFLILVLCSVVTLSVVLERAYYFWKRGADPHSVFAETMKKLRTGQVREASWICDACTHPVGAVSAEVLRGDLASGEVTEERLQIALSEQKLLLERNLGILGTMAAVAPLIGLLGTVWGIMRAFGDMARVGSAAPSVVAAGVAEALVTTAAGLVIAVPAVMCYNHFARRMNVMLTVAENHARSLRNSILGEIPSLRSAGPAPREGAPAGPEQVPVEEEDLLTPQMVSGG